MGREEVLEEVDRRIKRLQAEVELAEERLRYLDRIGAPSKYRALRREDYSIYYLLLMAVWVLLGFLALIAISHRLPYGFNFSLLPYLFVVLVVIVLPLTYYYLSRREEPKTPMDELEERERLARLVLSLFYVPLREAIEKDDRKAMEGLAEELLNNPVLAEAVEKTKEGDPKVMAYALYLYSTYRPEMEGEVRETLSILSNKPLRALLSTIIEG
ncbi:hypothetical protein [Thermococcus thioreducens]|uniref:Uncharacterized protein n=1 Tax=Thermococcus thioreducens TaxID=277988 RepID=A0A0Q2QP09_9EURY|nr:hypothetical protein [Thermococcus thioreducens]ASJ13103.1 hypothetical protein A3L14_09485 [Thermococcus thioreducens]KQH81613.1 hypothetical protein AMR53_10360 [Thermococcus thioreducens]SEV81111.1 hypothetical protein SAMN05216170_0042 [Thermococcus thioreducens]